MLFNTKKPYRVIREAQENNSFYVIEQPIRFLGFVFWKKIETYVGCRLFTVKYFETQQKAVNWAEKRKAPTVKSIVYDSRNFISDYKGLSRTVKQKNVQVKPISNTPTSSYVPPKPVSVQNN